MDYTPERREAVLRKMVPPNSRSNAVLAREEGVSAPARYGWRYPARRQGRLVPNKALAEAAALLVLRGKLVARYGEDEDG